MSISHHLVKYCVVFRIICYVYKFNILIYLLLNYILIRYQPIDATKPNYLLYFYNHKRNIIIFIHVLTLFADTCILHSGVIFFVLSKHPSLSINLDLIILYSYFLTAEQEVIPL